MVVVLRCIFASNFLLLFRLLLHLLQQLLLLLKHFTPRASFSVWGGGSSDRILLFVSSGLWSGLSGVLKSGLLVWGEYHYLDLSTCVRLTAQGNTNRTVRVQTFARKNKTQYSTSVKRSRLLSVEAAQASYLNSAFFYRFLPPFFRCFLRHGALGCNNNTLKHVAKKINYTLLNLKHDEKVRTVAPFSNQPL